MTDNRGEVKWMTGNQRPERKDMQSAVDAKYSRVGERIRHITPSALQCSMFCGGKSCKYDNPIKWKEEEMAIKGLYSSWITNDILAMARPSTFAIKEYDVINQFKVNGIATVINLQHPGEHASCGFGLEDSGFSYVPQQFMDEDVFFYNFCWDDYGVRALQSIVDMVKVMDFALMNGKVAIHCHAGLGRTGVLIACYFVYSQRMKGDAAINVVRAKRPRAIQTRGQIACVRDFEKYLQPMWIIYSNTINCQYKPFTLSQFLRRQAHLLHGEEERDLRYVPKVVFIISKRLLQLCGIDCELRNVAVLKIRILTSSSTSTSSVDSVDQRTASLIDRGRRLGSDSVIEQVCVDDDTGTSDTSLEPNVFYDSYADGTDDSVGMDELSPENFIHHSLSESVLLKSTQNLNVSTAETVDKVRSLPTIESNAQSYPTQRDTDNNNTKFGTARCLDSAEGIILNAKKSGKIPARNSSITLDRRPNDFESNSSVNSMKYSSNSQFSIETEARTSEKSIVNGEERYLTTRNSSHDGSSACVESILASFSSKPNYSGISTLLERYKNSLNTTEATWEQISSEDNAYLLCCLLWSWIEHLEEPIITVNDVDIILKDANDPIKAFELLAREKKKTLQVVLFTFLKISGGSNEFNRLMLNKIATVFTKCVPLPQTTRSERYAMEQDAKEGKMSKDTNFGRFLDFIVKLSNSEQFET